MNMKVTGALNFMLVKVKCFCAYAKPLLQCKFLNSLVQYVEIIMISMFSEGWVIQNVL